MNYRLRLDMWWFYLLSLLALLVSIGNGSISYNSNTKTLVHSSSDEQIKMIVMGDWGGLPFFPYYTPFEKLTAERIMEISRTNQPDFLLALGDNFYFTGVVNEYDQRFKETFEDVFNDESFKQVPWFVLAGNHDHYGNVTGQIEYTKHSERWYFPVPWYAIEVKRPNLNMTIVMIDTVLLCGNTLHDQLDGQPDGLVVDKMVVDQLEFIESILKNSKDQYLLVAGHFPVWSIAEHGPTKCLVDKLKPLLEKYQVNAYLCGHDHNLQHIREVNSPVEYIVSGAVDIVNPSTKHRDSIPDGSLQYHWANILGLGGFATLDATTTSMELKFYSATGGFLYKYAIPPRK